MGATKSADPRKEALLSRLKAIGQEHLVAFWDRLSSVEQETLAGQIERIDAELFRKLQEENRQQAAAGEQFVQRVLAALRGGQAEVGGGRV